MRRPIRSVHERISDERKLKTWKNEYDPSQKEATEITYEEALERGEYIDD